MSLALIAALSLLSGCKGGPKLAPDAGVVEAKQVSPPKKVNPPAPTAPAPGNWIPPNQMTQAEAMAEPLRPANRPDMTAEDLREWEASVRFHRGEAVDFDGDGYKESVGKWVNGVFTSTEDLNKDGKPDVTFDGTRLSIDSDFDGKPDEVTTTTGTTTVMETDNDHDGIFDERETTEILGNGMRVLRERRADPSGSYEVESDTIRPREMNAKGADLGSDETKRAACPSEVSARFTRDIEEPSIGFKGVRVLVGRDRCNETQASALYAALKCAGEKRGSCLSGLNPAVSIKLSQLLTRTNGITPAVISCSPCRLTGASTVLGMQLPDGRLFTAIEMPASIASATKKTACELVLHEMFHAAGYKGADDHDARGDDWIYSCGRICPGCSHYSKGWGDDHKDCATCAVGKLKAQCGVRITFGDGPAPPDPNLRCVRVTDKLEYAPCATTQKLDTWYCDRTYVNPSGCCLSCPPGYIMPGPDQCNGGVPLTDTCFEPPGEFWMCGPRDT